MNYDYENLMTFSCYLFLLCFSSLDYRNICAFENDKAKEAAHMPIYTRKRKH